MKTMCLPGYHHNGFVATHALGHMMYVYIYKYDLHVKHKRKKKQTFTRFKVLRGCLGLN